MTAITPTHWEKFLHAHSTPGKYYWSRSELTDSIWVRNILDWDVIIKAFYDNGLKFDKISWSERWQNNYIYLDTYIDSVSKKPAIEHCNQLHFLYNCDICFKNSATNFDLGYKGYASFGNYFRDLFAEAFYNNDTWVESKETFTQKFIECFIEAWNDTSKRIEIKEKKKTVNQKVQKIESDIDYAIFDLAEEFKKYDVEFNKEDETDSQSIVCSYYFRKKFYGYIDLSYFYIRIRKDLKGNYDMCWSLDKGQTNKMKHFKSDITAENMKTVIEGIFGPYLNIPATAVSYSIPNELLK